MATTQQSPANAGTTFPVFGTDAAEHARQWYAKRGHKQPFCPICGSRLVSWTYDVAGWLAGRCAACRATF